MPKTLYLIDGHAQIFRAYYAPFGNLSAPSGEPTRATHVFCQMLLNLIRDRRPDYLATVLDVSDQTVFRKDIYPDYKAHRDPPPEDFAPQHDRIISILEGMGMPILRREGFEADDIMATLAERYGVGDGGAADDLQVYLVSKDKDFEQLLTPRIAMFDPGKNTVITHENLFELKGWRPEQAVEVQCLTGDTVDNIPGVKGIGPKTAAKLIQKYGTARAVIEHADELTPKQRENVLAFEPQLEITRQLVTLRRDVPIEFELADADCSRLNWSAMRAAFRELGIRRLLEHVPGEAGIEESRDQEIKGSRGRGIEGSRDQGIKNGGAPPIASQRRSGDVDRADAAERLRVPERGEYTLVNTAETLEAFAAELAKQAVFAFDTETTGVDPVDADLVGLSFSWAVGTGWYLPVRAFRGVSLPLDLVRGKIGPILADPKTTKIGQNIKYDLIVARNAGMPIAGPLFDTMIASFVLDSSRRSHGMDALVAGLLGHQMIPISDLIGKGRDQLRMDEADVAHVCEYAAEDADYTWRLKELFEPQLAASGLADLFYKTEMPLVRVLADMEYNGITIDAPLLRKMANQFAARAEEITSKVYELVGTRFNLDSPKQLSEVLFDKLEFRVIKTTKTARSTDAETLETLARETEHELPTLLLEYREIQKLRGTYLEALPRAVSKRTGRIHTSFHQTGAVTGRLSSSNPNLQNIPIRTQQGREIRRAFVPRSADRQLIVADYSQIELRVLAHFCQDEALIRAFVDDLDIHTFVAAQINGVELADVTREMRSRAKAVNFGLIYGQTAFGLSRTTGMSRSEAQAFIDQYFARYPRIREFIASCVEQARSRGYVSTLLGRRREISGIDSRNRNQRMLAERLAVNTVVQGSAADLIKTAMNRLHERIKSESLPLRMLLQVHDELVCETPRAQAEAHCALVAEIMATCVPLRVPVKVDAHCVDNWLEGK